MNLREIPDIQEAEQLFQTAESSFPSEGSAKDFEEALEILDCYIEEESPEIEIIRFIENLKHSYIRSVITELNEIPAKEFHIFFHYLILLKLKMKQELEELTKTYPELQIAYNDCIKRFKPQMDELLEDME